MHQSQELAHLEPTGVGILMTAETVKQRGEIAEIPPILRAMSSQISAYLARCARCFSVMGLRSTPKRPIACLRVVLRLHSRRPSTRPGLARPLASAR